MASFMLKSSFATNNSKYNSPVRPTRMTLRSSPLKFNTTIYGSPRMRPILLSASSDDKDTLVGDGPPTVSAAEVDEVVVKSSPVLTEDSVIQVDNNNSIEVIDIENSYDSPPAEDEEDVWNSTYYPKLADASMSNKKWYVVDAENQTLGRLATKIARVIRGKDNPRYHPAMDMGDIVIVINAEKVKIGGNKYNTKLYRRHSGRPGGMKIETFKDLQARIPERIIEKAVWGMLPKNRLGRRIFHHMKVYKGPDHPHEAQKPEILSLEKYSNTKLAELQQRLEEEKSLAV